MLQVHLVFALSENSCYCCQFLCYHSHYFCLFSTYYNIFVTTILLVLTLQHVSNIVADYTCHNISVHSDLPLLMLLSLPCSHFMPTLFLSWQR